MIIFKLWSSVMQLCLFSLVKPWMNRTDKVSGVDILAHPCFESHQDVEYNSLHKEDSQPKDAQ